MNDADKLVRELRLTFARGQRLDAAQRAVRDEKIRLARQIRSHGLTLEEVGRRIGTTPANLKNFVHGQLSEERV